jgi:hypothetical protein
MISNLDELKLWMLSVIIWLLLGLTWIMPARAQTLDALPSSLSGVWCYQKYESQEASEDVDIYRREESIPNCANRGGFTMWPDGKGFTHGRFDVVRNSCKFERIDLIGSSSKDKTIYETRIACDDYDSEFNPSPSGDLEHRSVTFQYDGKEDRLIVR